MINTVWIVQARKAFRTRPSAAYVSYPVLRRYLIDLTVPPQPPSQGGGQETQRLRASLYYLGLLGDDGGPTLALEQMSRAEPRLRLEQLKSILLSRYDWLWDDSAPKTYDEFIAALREVSGLHSDTFARAERFVTRAARDLGLSLPVDLRRKQGSGERGRQLLAIDANDSTWRRNARKQYFDFLMSVVQRQTEQGTPDPALLDRIERYVAEP